MSNTVNWETHILQQCLPGMSNYQERHFLSILVKTLTNTFGFVIKSQFYCNGRILKLGIIV